MGKFKTWLPAKLALTKSNLQGCTFPAHKKQVNEPLTRAALGLLTWRADSSSQPSECTLPLSLLRGHPPNWCQSPMKRDNLSLSYRRTGGGGAGSESAPSNDAHPEFPTQSSPQEQSGPLFQVILSSKRPHKVRSSRAPDSSPGSCFFKDLAFRGQE